MLALGQDGDWYIFKESRKGQYDWSRKRERLHESGDRAHFTPGLLGHWKDF